MIAETKPDVVIVTTMDATHHQYICRAMELGCDAITEKPMTTDDAKARQIFDTIEKTGRSLRVTFNYRYAPLATTVRELIMEGTIGRPRHVDFSWVLDTRHGADYFRRWHREKDKSGGLLVHKSTHHFDLINWWIDSIPQTVYAQGDLHFYGRENAAARGETYTYDRYTGEEAAANDPFAMSLESDETLKKPLPQRRSRQWLPARSKRLRRQHHRRRYHERHRPLSQRHNPLLLPASLLPLGRLPRRRHR